jgi:hypothetical protein
LSLFAVQSANGRGFRKRIDPVFRRGVLSFDSRDSGGIAFMSGNHAKPDMGPTQPSPKRYKRPGEMGNRITAGGMPNL